jgi:alkanesulfonate monooxygenase SsuD/methylene tetrahydromethanopterin reductase-like flavin-dependent oxidoreductase (luciferase family)
MADQDVHPHTFAGDRRLGDYMIKPWVFEFMHALDRPADQLGPDDITDMFDDSMKLWERIEEQGFEGIFFSEHHFGHAYSPSPNLLIAAIAQRTSRMRLGTMGMVLPFYAPWRIAEEIAMLDHLTNGRLEIGCANGVPQELERVGMEPEEARERFNEALDIVDAALAEPVISYHGKYWNFDDLNILPRPRQQPSPPKWTTIVSKGSAKKSAGRGSKICTGFQSIGLITEIFDVYRDEGDRLDVPVGPDDIGLRRNVSVDRDEAAAHEAAKVAAELGRKLLAGDSRVGQENSPLLDAPTAGSGFSVHEDEFISGTPTQVAEQVIEQCRASGAGHFLAILGRGAGSRRAEFVELFGEEVVPELRRAEVAKTLASTA